MDSLSHNFGRCTRNDWRTLNLRGDKLTGCRLPLDFFEFRGTTAEVLNEQAQLT